MRRAAVAAAVLAAAASRLPAAEAQAPGPNYYAGDQSLTLVSLAGYPGAVCNDGTPGAYYFSAGSNANQWVLYLEGGACAARAARGPPTRAAPWRPATPRTLRSRRSSAAPPASRHA